MQIGKAPPALPFIRDEMGIGLVGAGWIASAILMVGAGVGATLGFIADRRGHRFMLVVGLLALLLGLLGGGFSPSFWILLVSRIVESVGYILVVVAGTPLVMSASSARNMRISLTIASTYFSFGTFVMMIAAPFTITALGWRGLWHVNAAIVLMVLIALLASIYISDQPGAHQPAHGFSWSDYPI